MKSVGGFLRNVVQRKEGGLVGRTFKVGIYTVRVEAHLGDGGFATIYRVRDTASGSAFALKHMRMGAEPDALADCHTEVRLDTEALSPVFKSINFTTKHEFDPITFVICLVKCDYTHCLSLKC